MNRLHGFLLRLRRALNRKKFEAEMAEEMRAHVDAEAAAHRALGEDPAGARRRAAVEFGHAEAYKEQIRDRRLGRLLDEAWQDTRYAARLLRKSPGFTLAAVATLALGIGANTAIFSVLDAILLRPLPYPEPGRLVMVFETLESGSLNSVSGGVFQDWRDYQTVFEGVTLMGRQTANLRGAGDPVRLGGLEVSHEFFRVLGIPLLRGRGFLPEEDVFGGATDVAVLTEDLWRSRFGASESLVGSTVLLDETPRTVVGIVPTASLIHLDVQFLVPAVLAPGTDRSGRSSHWADVAARLKPGVTVAQADAAMKEIRRRTADVYPAYKKNWDVAVRPLQTRLTIQARPVLHVLLGAVVLVLLIACANVANLLLARACHRQQELALRAALGAGSRRLVRQVLTESVLLAALGGLAGILLARWGVDLLVQLTADQVPLAMRPQLDVRVLGFALAITGATGLVFGLLPAWRSRRPDLNDALKNGGHAATAGRRSRLQSALVVAEVALSVVLLATAGLLLRSLGKMAAADPGFEPARVLAFGLSLPDKSYPTPGHRLAFIRRLLERLDALPGVERAGAGMSVPFAGGAYGEYIRRSDRPAGDRPELCQMDFVSDGYLEALGARLRAGRFLTVTDNRPDAPRVAVVSETTVRRFFPGEDPIGRMINVRGNDWEIVGVIAPLPFREIEAAPRPFVHVPQAFNPSRFSVALRTPLEPLSLVAAVRREIAQLDPGVPMAHVRPLDRARAEALGPSKLIGGLLAVFAGTALLLACVGLYGVMAYTVATRRRELCIRLALGAAHGDVIRQIVGDGLRLAAIGLVLGLVAAAGLTSLVQSLLFGVGRHDPLAFGGALLLLLVVALLACWLPAWRATRFNAIAALRND